MQREKERKEKNKQTNSNSGNTGSQSVSNDNMISECVTTYPPEHRFACVCTYEPVDENAGGIVCKKKAIMTVQTFKTRVN